MTALQTNVDGDTGSVRASADGIGALGGGLGVAASGFGTAAGQSEGQWSGGAGDAFRGKITSVRQATQTATSASRRLQSAMHDFADQMDQVKAKMKQAESVASAAGLHVSGNSIEQPKPPTQPPAACYAPSAAAGMAKRFQAEMNKYRKQLAAFHQAEQIIQQARQQENQAHTTLTDVVNETREILTEVKNSTVWKVAGAELGNMSHGLAQAQKWEAKAQNYEQRADNILKDMRSLPQDSAEYLAETKAYTNALADSAKAGDAADINRDIAGGLEDGAKDVLSRTGMLMSLASIGIDAANSKNRAVNLASDLASTGVGMGGGELIAAASLASAPETLGASIAVAAAAYGTGYAIEHYGPAAWKWAATVPGTIANGGQTVLHGIEQAPGTIANGAKTVAHGVEHAPGTIWHGVTSIFG
jgi:hypothetical protein